MELRRTLTASCLDEVAYQVNPDRILRRVERQSSAVAEVTSRHTSNCLSQHRVQRERHASNDKVCSLCPRTTPLHFSGRSCQPQRRVLTTVTCSAACPFSSGYFPLLLPVRASPLGRYTSSIKGAARSFARPPLRLSPTKERAPRLVLRCCLCQPERPGPAPG